jgi:glycosyltransferase involved in cell wall biosynthesis
MDKNKYTPLVSIVIPAFNEQLNIKALYEKIIREFSLLHNDYEIIFIDDGSLDSTYRIISELCQINQKVKGVRLKKNYKKSVAYMTGFELASGDIIITMDADLQDEPKEIPNFINQLDDFDLVVGWKFYRNDPWHKTMPSKVFNYIVNILFRTQIHDNDCGFRAMKSGVASALNLYGDNYRFIPAIAANLGYTVSEIKVKHNKRMFGESKYGWSRMITGALDIISIKMIIDYEHKPLHFFGTLGIFLSSTGVLAELYVTYFRIFIGDSFSEHMPMMILGILLILLGVQIIGIGLIAELTVANKVSKKINIGKQRISSKINF